MVNSKKRCKCCGKYYRVDNPGAKVLPIGFFADDNHVMQFVRSQNNVNHFRGLSVPKKDKKKWAKEKREFRAADKAAQMKLAQQLFNQYVRLRDADDGCISCDKPSDWHGQFHAGHYFSVGHSSSLRFNLWNVNKQCSVCNCHLSGNIGQYTPRLIAKIGQRTYDYLVSCKSDVKRFELEWLHRAIKLLRKKIKRKGK
ncbi:MAG TPA: recombination protein NinG [Gammaproteobacteria bacterium]|nr:recombination protein NinG [Gammaproteobacteria bacterium]